LEAIVARGVTEPCDNCCCKGIAMIFAAIFFGAVAIVSALGVVLFRNPLFSAFALVSNLLSVAAVYATMKAHFLAVSQVVVYAGAIMVLVLFVLMLLNLKSETVRRSDWTKLIVAGFGGVIIFCSVVPVVLSSLEMVDANLVASDFQAADGTVAAVGRLLYSEYVPQFELSSLVLLVGVVGAVMLTRKKSTDPSPREGGLTGGK